MSFWSEEHINGKGCDECYIQKRGMTLAVSKKYISDVLFFSIKIHSKYYHHFLGNESNNFY